MNRRVIRTIEYFGPAEQVDYILSKAIGPNGFTAAHVRIRELGVNEQTADGTQVAFVRDAREGEQLKENKDKSLTEDEAAFILIAITNMEGRKDQWDAHIDSIREKLNGSDGNGKAP